MVLAGVLFHKCACPVKTDLRVDPTERWRGTRRRRRVGETFLEYLVTLTNIKKEKLKLRPH